jgi:hypothetical protein
LSRIYTKKFLATHAKLCIATSFKLENYLNILVNGMTLPAKIINVDDSNILNVIINVHIEDTLRAICNNIAARRKNYK